MMMNANFFINLALVLGWLLVAFIAVALFAMAQFIGSQYAFTHLGVSRMGPRLGKRLGSTKFTHRREKIPLKKLATGDQWTLFVFLDASPLSFKLIPDLVEFASFVTDKFSFIIFYQGALGNLESLLNYSYFKVFEMTQADHDLSTRLGIRVKPYALLVHQKSMELVAKGLVNHTGHLCTLIYNAQTRKGERRELVNVASTICQPTFKEIESSLRNQKLDE